MPVIGSLNGVSSGGWIEYARKIEQAGADALELNCYYLPTEMDVSSAELEDVYVDLINAVRSTIKIFLSTGTLQGVGNQELFIWSWLWAGRQGSSHCKSPYRSAVFTGVCYV